MLLDSAALQRTLLKLDVRGEGGGRILTGITAGERIPSEARGTVTGGTVVSDLTHCIAGTRVGSNAGVDTSSVLTDLSVSTLRVRGAARWRRWSWQDMENISGDSGQQTQNRNS